MVDLNLFKDVIWNIYVLETKRVKLEAARIFKKRYNWAPHENVITNFIASLEKKEKSLLTKKVLISDMADFKIIDDMDAFDFPNTSFHTNNDSLFQLQCTHIQKSSNGQFFINDVGKSSYIRNIDTKKENTKSNSSKDITKSSFSFLCIRLKLPDSKPLRLDENKITKKQESQ